MPPALPKRRKMAFVVSLFFFFLPSPSNFWLVLHLWLKLEKKYFTMLCLSKRWKIWNPLFFLVQLNCTQVWHFLFFVHTKVIKKNNHVTWFILWNKMFRVMNRNYKEVLFLYCSKMPCSFTCEVFQIPVLKDKKVPTDKSRLNITSLRMVG